MGANVGASVQLDHAPLKYQGLSYTEVWISEAQERMVLAVPPQNLPRLRALCQAEDVEICDLGHFGQVGPDGRPELLLRYQGHQVGRLSMELLHEGLPQTELVADNSPANPPSPATTKNRSSDPITDGEPDIQSSLLRLLAHPNIASKQWIIRQYDHEVQGGSVIKPLVGPGQDGPGDAAVLRPKLNSQRAIAIACGLLPGLSEKAVGGHGDSYWMALAAIDEAVRNAVCVGADPTHIAILDNFCWPSVDRATLASLVRAAEGCYDGALAYKTPFISGKDSLNNQFLGKDENNPAEPPFVLAIPPTLLITALGIVPDVSRCITMDAKAAGNHLIIIGTTSAEMGGSHYLSIAQDSDADPRIPHVDLVLGPQTARAVAQLIDQQLVASAHDCSDGGLLVAAAEIAFAGRIGLRLDLGAVPTPLHQSLPTAALCFAETPSRYLLEIAPQHLADVTAILNHLAVPFAPIGALIDQPNLIVRSPKNTTLLDAPLDPLRQAWLSTLDW
jgi:phosphoribosylformylglycinamidine synthase